MSFIQPKQQSLMNFAETQNRITLRGPEASTELDGPFPAQTTRLKTRENIRRKGVPREGNKYEIQITELTSHKNGRESIIKRKKREKKKRKKEDKILFNFLFLKRVKNEADKEESNWWSSLSKPLPGTSSSSLVE